MTTIWGLIKSILNLRLIILFLSELALAEIMTNLEFMPFFDFSATCVASLNNCSLFGVSAFDAFGIGWEPLGR